MSPAVWRTADAVFAALPTLDPDRSGASASWRVRDAHGRAAWLVSPVRPSEHAHHPDVHLPLLDHGEADHGRFVVLSDEDVPLQIAARDGKAHQVLALLMALVATAQRAADHGLPAYLPWLACAVRGATTAQPTVRWLADALVPSSASDDDEPSLGLQNARHPERTTWAFCAAAACHATLTGAVPSSATCGASKASAGEREDARVSDSRMLADSLDERTLGMAPASDVQALVAAIDHALHVEPQRSGSALSDLARCLAHVHRAIAPPPVSPNAVASGPPAAEPPAVQASSAAEPTAARPWMGITLAAVALVAVATGAGWAVGPAVVVPDSPAQDAGRTPRVRGTPLNDPPPIAARPDRPTPPAAALPAIQRLEVTLEQPEGQPQVTWSDPDCAPGAACSIGLGSTKATVRNDDGDPTVVELILNVDAKGALVTAQSEHGIVTTRPPRGAPVRLRYDPAFGLSVAR